MSKNITIIVYPVQDVDKAKIFFSKFLQTEPYVADSYYIGYKVGDQEIGLDPNSKIGPIAYIDVEDIKTSIQEMIDVGAELIQDVREVGGGLLIAQIKDSSGNIFGFRQETIL